MFSSSSARLVTTRLAPAAALGAALQLSAERRVSSVAPQQLLQKVSSNSMSRLLLLQQQQPRAWFPFNSTSYRSVFLKTKTTTRSFTTAPPPVSKPPPSSAAAAPPVNTTTTSSAKPASGGGGFMAWYEGHLTTRPVLTKMITGTFLWGIGDAVAQVVPVVAANHSGNLLLDNFQYDVPRTARAAFFGFALHAPLSHLHFNFLEWMTVKAGLTGYSIPIFKTIMEQFVYWSWVSNSLYHGAMGLLQGYSLQQCYDRIKAVLWETQVAQWQFWIPIQLLNFQFIPVRHQLNIVLLTSIVWTALLSAWYPPQTEDDGDESDDETKKVALRRMKSSLMTTAATQQQKPPPPEQQQEK